MTGDLIVAALVVGGGAEAPRRRACQFDAIEIAVERQIEIQPGLFAVGDDIQACAGLVVNRGDHRVLL